jgi:hypothetical protein
MHIYCAGLAPFPQPRPSRMELRFVCKAARARDGVGQSNRYTHWLIEAADPQNWMAELALLFGGVIAAHTT